MVLRRLVLLLLWLPFTVRRLASPDGLKRLALAFVSFALALLGAEMALRWAGFSYRIALSEIEFGHPDPRTMKVNYLPDRDLFWVPPDYRARLRELERSRPDLLFLGDSVTAGSYPEHFLEAMRTERRELQGASLAVAGWTSFQGLQQLRRDVVRLRPRVVTLFFGWNDHWYGYGISDEEVHRILRTSAFHASELRLAQLWLKARVGWATAADAHPPRVSLDEYRANLVEMVRLSRRAGTVPVLLTAPSSHERGHEPAYLAERWLTNLSDLVPLHQSYVKVVREVAWTEAAPLCDLAARFEQLPRRERARLFTEDGIHPNEEGHRVLAGFLRKCFDSQPKPRRALQLPSAPLEPKARGPSPD